MLAIKRASADHDADLLSAFHFELGKDFLKFFMWLYQIRGVIIICVPVTDVTVIWQLSQM